ncbi:MAG: IS66 family insertion sequence element accessory protein TnpB [Betaproteobacteria bacterium]|uniref:IS66 family insertion sequence element accessory protein TnpB n=1 Tax=Silanimonas sp. TaxID=1929290 RepID=UPI0022C56007|nr:IS66 family insertion sequence element accessory protein TnpB [Silanimonas sp.]MCZ8167293.1 IS66 family insertion sequence element accessory protein TnpB [Silanimonas sp.]
MIRVDAIWLTVQPLDMRLGTEAGLACVVGIFGAAHPNHAYFFAKRRANRMKVLVHDGKVTQEDVLAKVLQGLTASEEVLSRDESRWVVRRLAELLNWEPLLTD